MDYLEPMVAENSQGPAISAEEDIHTYRCGDFASIVSSTPFLPLPSLDNITMTSSWLNDSEIGTLRNTEKYLWGQMVVRRNRKMTKAIDALLKRTRNVTYFFALGAGENPCTEINKSKYTSACMYTCRRMNLFKFHVHVYACVWGRGVG